MSARHDIEPVCERVREILAQDDGPGSVVEEDQKLLSSHLNGCEVCSAWQEGWNETLTLLEEAELPNLPEGFEGRLWARLEGVAPENTAEASDAPGVESSAEVEPSPVPPLPASKDLEAQRRPRGIGRLWPMVAVFLCGAAMALAGVWVAKELAGSSTQKTKQKQGSAGERPTPERRLGRPGSRAPSKGPSLLDFFWRQIQQNLKERNRLRETGGMRYQSRVEPRERHGSREMAPRVSRVRPATPRRRGSDRLGDPKGGEHPEAREPRRGAGGGAKPRGAGNGDEAALRNLLRRKRLENRAKLDERQRRKLQERLEERRKRDQNKRHEGRTVGPDGAGGAGGSGRRNRGGR